LDMGKVFKPISVMLFGSVAWVISAIALPVYQMHMGQDYSDNMNDSVITLAYAEDKNSSEDTSSSYDFSSAALVCISKSLVLSTLGFSSEGDDESEDGESDGVRSETVNTSYINSLPNCTVFGDSSVAGIWVPFEVVIRPSSEYDSVSLNSAMTGAYFNQLAAGVAGLSGTPSNSTMKSQREISGS